MKAAHLQPLCRSVQDLAASFSSVAFIHVARALNANADLLANAGADASSDIPATWLLAR